jgi:[ribosomal protein S18]-alanine N-acetyltransferase
MISIDQCKSAATMVRQMTIRPAKPSDISRILELERGAATAAHWKQDDYVAMLAGVGARRVVLVAEERKNLLGFIVAQSATDEWEIENVVVAAEARRRRLASRLIERLLDIATSYGAISLVLEVRESNLAARALYASAGFVEASRRPKYYSNPEEDAVICRLDVR